MKILYYGYRDWSINIFNNLNIEKKCLVTFDDYTMIDIFKPDLIFFIGWSKIVPENIINRHMCICLHPSKLPAYRGGSPIQHQIISGEKESAVTAFIMNEILDGGDIIYQQDFSIDKNLDEIFKDIELIGIDIINKIIREFGNNNLKRFPQDLSRSKVYKRRTPSESEITIDEILNNDPIYLYNKIRALNDPYPNAYISCKNGKKLFITKSYYEK